MKKSSLLAGFFALATLLSGAVAWKTAERARHWEREAAFFSRQLAVVRKDRDRLAETVAKAKRAERETRNRQHCREVEKQTAALRGLPFLKPVVYRTFHPSEIPAIFERKVEEKYSKEKLQHYFRSLALLGLLPEGYSIEDYAALLQEQILAFYDDQEQKVYLAADIDLDKTFNRMILAHELTHALQDQHYHLSRFLDPQAPDDTQTTRMSLVEGDAMVVMGEWLLQYGSRNGAGEVLLRAFMQSYDRLLTAPPYIRNQLLFPYLQGKRFIEERGSTPAQRETLFRNPPETTLQILKPRREVTPPPAFLWNLARLKAEPAAKNVIGALGLQSLLYHEEEAVRNHLPSEWDGDHYLYFSDPASLIWRTRWKTAEAAETFEKALERHAERHPGRGNGRILEIVRFSPREVVFLNAPSREQAALLKELLVP